MDVQMECPICRRLYPMSVVEKHAAWCGLSPNERWQFHTWLVKEGAIRKDHGRSDLAATNPEVQPRAKEEVTCKSEGVRGTGGVEEEQLKGATGGQEEDGMPCPVCQVRFPQKALQDHAELCGETPEVIWEVIGNISVKCPTCQNSFTLKDIEYHPCISTDPEKDGENLEDAAAELETIIDRYIEDEFSEQSDAKGDEVNLSRSQKTRQTTRSAIDDKQEDGKNVDEVDQKEPVIEDFFKHLIDIGNNLDNDEIFQEHLEKLWLQCKQDPFKFFKDFTEQCATYALTSRLNPQCVVPYIVRYVQKKITEKEERIKFLSTARIYIRQCMVPWVTKNGGWRLLVGWFCVLMPIGGVAYLVYTAYQRYQSWGKQPEMISHSEPPAQSEESMSPSDVP